MTLLIGFLSFVLVLNCLLLVLLVLIQLPKKEAGAGVAFGASATDALFGAGSGNALTKSTRYAATFFVGVAIVLGLLWSRQAGSASRRLEQAIQEQTSSTPPPAQLPLATNPLTPPPAAALVATNLPSTPVNQNIATNQPAAAPAATTNAPAAAPNQSSATPPTTVPGTPAPAPPQTPATNPQ